MVKTRQFFLTTGKITMEERELPPIKPNEILVKTKQTSVCGSERYAYKGILVRQEDEPRHRYIPPKYRSIEPRPKRALGHEGGGTVVEVGSAVGEYIAHPGQKVQVGDRVGNVPGGWPTYSDYGITTVWGLQPIPDEVPFEIGCLYEPFGCSGYAAMHMGAKPGDYVSINGCGFAGMTLMQGAVKYGASLIIGVDVVDKKLENARKLVAKSKAKFVAINPLYEDYNEVINTLTDDEGVDVACECIGGTGIGIKQALDQVKHNGIMSLYGDNYIPFPNFCFNRFHEDGLEIRNLNAVHWDELRNIINMNEAYRAQVRGVFDDLWPIIWEGSDTYDLNEVPEVFAKEAENIHTQTSIKTVFVP